MYWKKTLAYFAWQSVRHAESWAHFRAIWSYRARWSQMLKPNQNSVNNELAWVSFEALDYLDQYLKPAHTVFEYGGGGSTLFFLNRAGSVVTVENHHGWVEKLKTIVSQKPNKNWQIFALEGVPQAGQETKDPADPMAFRSNAPNEESLSYEAYVRCIEQFPKASFDVVMVDGRARPSCIQYALPYLKPNALLIIDNMERSYYTTYFKAHTEQDFECITARMMPLLFHPDFTKTAIFRKKS